jgi:hypothetical protein
MTRARRYSWRSIALIGVLALILSCPDTLTFAFSVESWFGESVEGKVGEELILASARLSRVRPLHLDRCDSAGSSHPVSVSAGRQFAVGLAERSKMNGLGTHLLI